jgi:hypothetical protein
MISQARRPLEKNFMALDTEPLKEFAKENGLWQEPSEAAEPESLAGNNGEGDKPAIEVPPAISPATYLREGIHEEDILLGDGFLERGCTLFLIAQSGVGKSSAIMQTGCCWAIGKGGDYAFDLNPFKGQPLRIVMIQNEDSRNDCHRQSRVLNAMNFTKEEKELIEENFKIITLRGKLGQAAFDVVRAYLDKHERDILVINPISAYAKGDLAQTDDCVEFLYNQFSPVLDTYNCGALAVQHTPKMTGNRREQQKKWTTYDYMYSGAGAATITNYSRGIVTIDAIGNSETFAWRVAKRWRESGWLTPTQFFKWKVLEESEAKLWVPASSAEGEEAKATSTKTLDQLLDLVPMLDPIPKNQLKNLAIDKKKFKHREYEGLLSEALADSTPDDLRLYEWRIYNPAGGSYVAIARREQLDSEKPEAVKAQLEQERRQNAKIIKIPKSH